MKLRGIFQTFLFALIFAVGANGVVMASNDVMHQKHCVHANVDQALTTHDHAGHSDHHETSNDAAPEHDHNTCMMHACSAVVNEAYGTVALPVFLSSAQRAPEIELTALERVDGPLRPPNT